MLLNILCAVKIEDQRLLSQTFSRKFRGSDHLKRKVEGGIPVHCVAHRKMAMVVREVSGQSISASAVAKSQTFRSLSRRQAVIHRPSCVNTETEKSTLIKFSDAQPLQKHIRLSPIADDKGNIR